MFESVENYLVTFLATTVIDLDPFNWNAWLFKVEF